MAGKRGKNKRWSGGGWRGIAAHHAWHSESCACSSIDDDGMTTHLFVCQKFLSSPFFSQSSHSPSSSLPPRCWGGGGRRRDGVAAESAPSVLPLMSRSQHPSCHTLHSPPSHPAPPSSCPGSGGGGALLLNVYTSVWLAAGVVFACVCAGSMGWIRNEWNWYGMELVVGLVVEVEWGWGYWFDKLCQAANRRL